jgi:hypothetical protein
LILPGFGLAKTKLVSRLYTEVLDNTGAHHELLVIDALF